MKNLNHFPIKKSPPLNQPSKPKHQPTIASYSKQQQQKTIGKLMMSHKKQKNLAKKHFEEVEASLAESSISSAYSTSLSTSSTPKSYSSKSLSKTASARIQGDTSACFDHESLTSSSRISHSARLLRFADIHGRKITGSRCLSALHKSSWQRLKHSLGGGSISNMAGRNDLDSPSLIQKKKRVAGQKKEELEKEVSVLHEMLDHEQKVHQYMEQLQHRKDGSALTIPSFIPPNMKEVLIELEMVENEITLLESQIEQLKSDVKHEKEASMETKYKEWGRGDIRNRLESSPLSPHPNRKLNNEKVAFEPKAMHFISKAIKGESMNEKTTSFRELLGHNENTLQEEVGGIFREKVKGKSGMLKSPSPLRERRNPTPRRDRSLEFYTDSPHKALSTPLHLDEENIQRWPPNKLSENIMKCLFFIFGRLLRKSKIMELEKSGPIARFTNFSLSSRADTSSSSSQKDTRQQDPYGIFDSEESIPRDIGPYKNLVRFTSSSMYMKYIQKTSSVPLFQRLKLLMDGLEKVDLRFLSHQQKLAFWINMYNACIMNGYLQYGVPSVFSPGNLLALVNQATLNIGGNTINAQAIEHFILRKPKDKLIKEIVGKDDIDSKKMIVSDLYGLESPDPNIIFALCCGTRSSPAAKVYTADGATAELERSKLEYLQAAIMVTNSKRIAIPELLLRNMKGFAADKGSLIEWICNQLPASCSLRKSIVDCFRGLNGAKVSAVVEKIPYEFEFQYLLAM